MDHGESHSHHAGARDDPAMHGGQGSNGGPGPAGHDKHEGHSPEIFRDRLLLSVVLTFPILYLSTQIQDWFGYSAVEFAGDSWVNPVLVTVLFVYAGGVFLRGGVGELKARVPGMMTLISMAITVAYVYSVAVSLGLDGKPFYWELATLLDVMLLGHWMEMRSVQSASSALDRLAAMVPQVAHRLDGHGEIEDVSVSALGVGDQILIKPGEQVPVDGEVLEGTTSVNEAFLTGESRPVTKAAGDEVVAASVNGEGALTVAVTRTGDDTALSQIMRLVRDAQESRSRFQALADRAAFWLTIIAIGTAIPTLVGWLLFGSSGATFAVARAVTVLVIACPHALGLAIPLVTVNATSVSAGHGILVRNREAFERGRDVSVVAFDKTGTLTEGRFVVKRTTAVRFSEAVALQTAAALERASEHPLAGAIVEAAPDDGFSTATAVEAVPGHGISGVVDGVAYRVGRPEWAVESGLELADELDAAIREADAEGDSAVVVMDDQAVLAVISLADKVRESARRTVAELHRLDIEPVMITGDAEAVARTVAADVGISRYFARVLPEEKASIIDDLKNEGHTAFVGDGINDAPALLHADLGIAIGAGTNVAIESADLVLVNDDPIGVVRSLELARATRRKMTQNLAWATGYNAIALPLAAGVAASAGILLSPAVGALFMSLSTVIVSINAMTLRRIELTA